MNTPASAAPARFASAVVTLRNNAVNRVAESDESREAVAGDDFVQAMRGAATGVNIVTTDGAAGRFGLTVSAFSSVSAEPPMVLVCINRRSPACTAMHKNRRFCVNVLSEAQRAIADSFAGDPATGRAYDFGVASWTVSQTGSPILDKSIASFDCAVATVIDAGSHSIFVGAVKDVTSNAASPLLYTDGSYRRAGNKL